MNCPACGFENREDAGFCGECGASLAREIRCPSCQRSNPRGRGFCDGCGRPLGEPTPERAPRDYTPRHLADKILQSKPALEGERKQVTVLFADVKGSLELAEQVDAEEWHQILERFFQILADGVHRFEGTVNQYTGDGIMALFGAPIAHEDHAQRACYAALHLRDELRRYAREVKREHGVNFSVRIGLNSGEVVVGKIGDDLRMDYTAQGHAVGLAARMQELAEPGNAYLTQHTAALVSGYFELEDLGSFPVRGASEPIPVFLLREIGALRTRFEISRARGLSRFVGRERETRMLEAALEQAFEGQGQVVGVVGEAGVGKSRLCFEFVEGCRARGIAVYDAHCPSYGKAVPFLPALELLRNFFGIAERDDDREARRKIAGTLVLLEERFQEVLPLVFDFLGVPDPERPPTPMEPAARQRQLFAFVHHLMQARSAREPAVNLVDDVHWIDAGSDAFLAQLVEAVARTRTLLVVNFRPEYSAPWTERSYYQQIALQPLGPEAVDELVRGLLGADPSLGSLADLIRQRTGGNPFFVEEVVRSLAESGALEGQAGAYRLARPVEEIAIPASVQSVLAARIDRLPEREKSVLQAAAVIGKRFPEPVLRWVAEMPEGELRGALATLTGAEFLYEETLYPEAEYAFKHPLTQEVAYTSQLAQRRAGLHVAVARTIAELHPGGPDEHAALVAHHWEGAGEALEAARWHRRAAQWVGRSDRGEALRHWSAVGELLAGEAESPETLSLDLSARIHVLDLYWRLGASAEDAARVFEQGRELAARSGDLESLAMLTGAYGAVRGLAGELSEYGSHCEEAVRLADRTGNRGIRVAMRWRLGYALQVSGRLRDCLALAEEGIELCDGDPTLGAEIVLVSPLVGFLCYSGVVHSFTGRLEEARRDAERALRLAREIDDSEGLAYTLANLVQLEEYTGIPGRGLDQARQALDLAERVGSAFTRIWAQNALSEALLLREDFGPAAAAASAALEIVRESRTGIETQPWHLANLALARLGLGEVEAARESAREAVAIARRLGLPIAEIWAHIALARTLLRTGDKTCPREAGRSLARAAALVRETGALRFEPFIRVERAELSRLAGDSTAAERELREAHRLFTGMGATGHAERLARELTG